MYFLYNFAIAVSWVILHFLALFNPKIRKFVSGRKHIFSELNSALNPEKPLIWIHAASLGEFEQGLPVMENLRSSYPKHQILLTFFSPSGYEVRKNTAEADLVCYLPIDSMRNAKKFIKAARPELAIFIKYEIWPNYLRVLQSMSVPVILISAIFSQRQIYFKWYGGFMRKALRRFSHIFVQNEASKARLEKLDINMVTVSGDTRFDRVAKIREQNNQLDFMDLLKDERPCFVMGSTWPEDEEILIDYINNSDHKIQHIIVPHDIKSPHLRQLQSKLKVDSILWSVLTEKENNGKSVLIVDTVGLLTKIYSYADIAYVGGGFATGLHNTLEPAVFGIPVIIGPEYHNFQEAIDLVHEKGVLVVNNNDEFRNIKDQLIEDLDFREHTGLINSNYINHKRGASIQIMDHLRRLL